MTDLTKITTPYGLLDPETQAALREYEGPKEVYVCPGWEPAGRVMYYHQVYRAKPQPREWWLNVYEGATTAYDTKAQADRQATPTRLACVRVREVIDE